MAAWKNQAPEASFSGLTANQAEAALAPPLRQQLGLGLVVPALDT